MAPAMEIVRSTTAANREQDASPPLEARRRGLEKLQKVALPFLCTFSLSIGNVVMQKVRAVPWENLTVFATLLNVLAYCVVYAACLFISKRQGYATPMMFDFISSGGGRQQFREPLFGFLRVLMKTCCQRRVWIWLFMASLCDTTSTVLSLISASKVNGTIYAISHYFTLPSVVIASFAIARTEYSAVHLFAAFVVLLGGLLSVLPAMLSEQSSTSSGDPFSTALGASAWVFYGIGYGFRELVFKDYRLYQETHPQCAHDVQGALLAGAPQGELSIFAVKLPIAIMQLLTMPLLFAISPEIRQTDSVVSYLQAGLTCLGDGDSAAFVHAGEEQCVDAWQALVVFLCFNLSTNICMTWLLIDGGPVLLFVALYAALPVTSVVFTFDLPLVPGAPMPSSTIPSLLVLMAGTAMYLLAMAFVGSRPCCWPFRREFSAPPRA